MSFCTNCGAPLRPGQVFCTSCGKKIVPSDGAPNRAADNEETNYLAKTVPVSEPIKEPKNNKTIYIILAVAGVLVMMVAAGTFGYLQGYFLDKESPKAMITSPITNKNITLSSNQTARETVEVKATDNRVVKKMELYINDSLVKEFNKNESYTYIWETSEPGKYVFKAIAFDNGGNRCVSELVSVNVTKKNEYQQSNVNNQFNTNSQNNETQNVQMAVYRHYENIPNNLTLAYSYFSKKLQSELPLDSWIKGFPRTLSDTVDYIYVTQIGPYDAAVNIAMTSKDNTGEGKIMIRKWSGQLKMVKEGGQWKIDQPSLKKTNEYYE